MNTTETHSCPKCGAALPCASSRLDQCPACGVYFAKLGQPVRPPASLIQYEEDAGPAVHWSHWLWPAEAPSPAQRTGWSLLLAGMLLWGLWFVTRDIVEGEVMKSFLHLPNLAFHEAGHVLFIPFGEFMTILGGSLLQFLVPLVVAIAFLRRHDVAGASAGVWWSGQNLLDVAPYIADARSLDLPLIGEYSEEMVDMRALRHDWHNILERLDLLQYDLVLARLAWLCGTLIMLGACVWLAAVLWRYRSSQL